MCRGETEGAAVLLASVLALAVWPAAGQTPTAALRPDWRTVGTTAIELMLASPATGPVDAVWFSADGSTLYARTSGGATFETADFEKWRPSEADRTTEPEPAPAERMPEPEARVLSAPGARLYALGSHLYRSDDGGRSWLDLTGYGSLSVIGEGAGDLAIAPGDPEFLVVANRYGVWGSRDGGLSWSGLNEGLANLRVRRILSTPSGAGPARILVDGAGTVELDAARGRNWIPAPDSAPRGEDQARQAYSEALGVAITAAATSGDFVYAGAADGRLFVSPDRGRTWPQSSEARGAPVEGIFADPLEPRLALAALGARGKGARVVRTINGGVFWDDLTADLPDGPAHAVAADRASGAIYLATDRGVWFTRGDLAGAGPATPWVRLTAALPAVPARDVRLGANGNQIYAALDGYGVFAAPAPHRAASVRWVNAADFSTRPAAPGSLLSVLGARVDRASGGGLDFPVLAASSAESQIQVPYDAAGPVVSLALNIASHTESLSLPVADVSPAIFVDRDGSAMLLDGDSGLMLDAGNAARSGSRIQILAAGLGRVRPSWPAGVPAPLENPPEVVAPVRVFLDRAPVEVTRAVLAPGYVGFYLIEVQLPRLVNAGPSELYLTAGDRESNRVRLYVEP